MSILLTLITPFIGSVLAIIAASLAIFSNFTSWIGPILNGVAEFGVWYIKQFFSGLGVIVQHLETLAVIFLIVAISVLYIHHLDKTNFNKQVSTIKANAAKKNAPVKHTASKPRVVRPTQDNSFWPGNPFGL